MKKQISSISVRQAGKTIGLYYGLLTCLAIPIGLVQLIVGGEKRFGGFIFLLAPLIYFIAGYLLGCFGAAVYNFVAQRFGGLEFTVEDVGESL